MLPQIAYLHEQPDTAERRSQRRREVRFATDANSTAGGTRVLLVDLSETGLRFLTGADLHMGEHLDFFFPEAGQTTARIVRQRGFHEFGAEFLEPLPKAAVSATLLAAPVEAPPVPASAVTPSQEPHTAWIVPPWMVELVLAAALIVVTLFVLTVGFLPIGG